MTAWWRTSLFDLGAVPYAFYTAQGAWRSSCGQLVAYFPAHAEQTYGRPLRVVDLGCGPGVTALEMARRADAAGVVGVDVAPGMIRQARRAWRRTTPEVARRVRFLHADASHLPFGDGTVDVVTGHSFLYLLSTRDAVLAEARRILRPGGRAIFMEPHAGHVSLAQIVRYSQDPRFVMSVILWRAFSRMHARYTEASLLNELARAGFRAVASQEVLGGLGVIGAAER